VDLQNKKIWITTGGGIGDTIMFTSALRRIKEKYPSCHLTFMTRWPNHTLLRGIPYLDEVTYIRRGTPLGRWRVLPSFLGLSDFRRQDAVVFTDWQPQLLIAAKLSRIPLRAGYPRENHPLSKHLTKSISPHVMQSSAYAAETNARVFSDALGVNLDGDMSRPDVGSPTEEEHRHVSELLEQIGLKKNASFFLLSPFAGFTERNWPLEEARIFVKHAEKYFERPVVVIAPPEKEKEARELSSLKREAKHGNKSRGAGDRRRHHRCRSVGNGEQGRRCAHQARRGLDACQPQQPLRIPAHAGSLSPRGGISGCCPRSPWEYKCWRNNT